MAKAKSNPSPANQSENKKERPKMPSGPGKSRDISAHFHLNYKVKIGYGPGANRIRTKVSADGDELHIVMNGGILGLDSETLGSFGGQVTELLEPLADIDATDPASAVLALKATIAYCQSVLDMIEPQE